MIAYVVDESTILTEQEAWEISWGLNYQAQFHFGRSGWRSDVYCIYVPKNVSPKIKPGSIVIHLTDSIDVQGALGYHDEDGNEVPYAKVGIKECQADNDPVSEVASHELLELAVDPHVNDVCISTDGTKLWAKEVGDPCQGNGYDVGINEGHVTGCIVADFVLPSFFDPNTPSTAKTTYRGSLSGSFQCGPQGYYSYVDLNNINAGWQETFGEKRTALPTWSNRISRRKIQRPIIT